MTGNKAPMSLQTDDNRKSFLLMRQISLKNRGMSTKALKDFLKLVFSLSFSDFGVCLGILRFRVSSLEFRVQGLEFKNKDKVRNSNYFPKPDNERLTANSQQPTAKIKAFLIQAWLLRSLNPDSKADQKLFRLRQI